MTFKIYTRTGDDGTTGLFGGQRVLKNSIRIETFGAVDELNAALGTARTLNADAQLDSLLEDLQNQLFDLGADLATPEAIEGKAASSHISRVPKDSIDALELSIDIYEAELQPLRNFILPGGHPLAAALHTARVICRRAERFVVSLEEAEIAEGHPPINPTILRYINRLSDLLFVLARVANSRNQIPDVLWSPRKAILD